MNLLQGLDVNALACPAGASPVLAFETSSFYFVGVDTLASALERLDRRRQALEVLEEASRQQHWSYPFSQELWMEVELHRARLYRELGRVEDGLEDLLNLADPDFWLVEELERIGS